MGFMGLGKWTYEVDKAADATESRRKLDVEIEETEEMRQKKLVRIARTPRTGPGASRGWKHNIMAVHRSKCSVRRRSRRS
jgi:hypothetical protein